MTDGAYEKLEAAWKRARADGVLGGASIQELIEHTAGYVSAVCAVSGQDAATVGGLGIDVGTGAGVPGVLLALSFPRMKWRLVDASEQRCDFARAAVRAAGVGDRVTVRHARGEDLGHEEGWREAHDVAVARLLGPPAETTELLVPLVCDKGVAVVSTRADGSEAWEAAPLDELGIDLVRVDARGSGVFVTLSRAGAAPQELPRRRAVRRRSPLF